MLACISSWTFNRKLKRDRNAAADEAIAWLDKLEKSDTTEADRREFMAWFKTDSIHREQFVMMAARRVGMQVLAQLERLEV
jgi:ferric-dicitrate binding protein FerR (iron transport regulator)